MFIPDGWYSLRGSPIIAIETKGDDSPIKALGKSVTNLTYIHKDPNRKQLAVPRILVTDYC